MQHSMTCKLYMQYGILSSPKRICAKWDDTSRLWSSIERANAFLFVKRFFGLSVGGLLYSLPRNTTMAYPLETLSTDTKTPPLSASRDNAIFFTCSKFLLLTMIFTNSRYFQCKCMFSTVPSKTPRLPETRIA